MDSVIFILDALGKNAKRDAGQTPTRFEKTIDWNRILSVAGPNKLSYSLCSSIAQTELHHQNRIFNSVLEEGKRNLAKQQRTLEFITDTLGDSGIDFLLIKTYKGHPYVTDDVDILVRGEESHNAVASFQEAGAVQMGGSFMVPLLKTGIGNPAYTATGILNVDIYDAMPWSSLRCVDEDFIWSNVRRERFAGIDCSIPSVEADLLTLLATSLFTDGKLTLLDIIYAKSLMRGAIDLSRPIGQARKYGWCTQFSFLLDVLNKIEEAISGINHVDLPTTMPYRIPPICTFSALQSLLGFELKHEPKKFGRGLVMIGYHFFVGRLYIAALSRRSRGSKV